MVVVGALTRSVEELELLIDLGNTEELFVESTLLVAEVNEVQLGN